MKQSIIFIILFLLLASISYSALTHISVIQNTGNNIYITNRSGDYNFNCSLDRSNPDESRIVNLSIWSNHTGVWQKNATNSSAFTDSGGVNFHIVSLTNGIDILWNCQGCNTSASCKFGTNYTAYVRRPAIILYGSNQVADGAYDNDGIIFFNFTAVGSSSKYVCELYMNYSGTFAVVQNYYVTDSTYTSFNYYLPELMGTVYNFRCYHTTNPLIYGWNSSNRTIHVDKTKPVVTLITPTDGYYDSDGTIAFTINASDINLNSCELWTITNGNPSEFRLNQTNSSMVNNKIWSATAVVFGRDVTTGYKWNAMCDDSAGNEYYASNYTFYVESNNTVVTSNVTGYPRGYCDSIQINWSTVNIETNGSVAYGTSLVASDGIAVSSSSYDTTSHSAIIDGLVSGVTYYYNITSCSSSAICNSSIKGLSFTFPESLCSGWNWYAIEDDINFSDLATATNADYLYYWNNTAQDWIYYSDAYTTRKAFDLTRGEAVAIHTETDEVLNRALATAGNNTMNMNGTINFMGVQNTRTFGELDYSLMWYENSTKQQVVSHFETVGFYNNSLQEWTFHEVNWSNYNTSVVSEDGVIFLYKSSTVPNGTWNRNASNGHEW